MSDVRELLEGREDDNLRVAGFCAPPYLEGLLQKHERWRLTMLDAAEMGEIARKRVEDISISANDRSYRRLYEVFNSRYWI